MILEGKLKDIEKGYEVPVRINTPDNQTEPEESDDE